MSINFNFIAKKTKNRYWLIAEQYGVAIQTGDLVSGIKELEERVVAVMAELQKAGVKPDSDPERILDSDRKPKLNASFAATTTAVAAFFALFVIIEISIFSQFFGPNSTIGLLLQHPAQFLIRLGDRAEQLPPRQIDNLKAAIHKILQKGAPLIDELESPRK